MVRVGAPAGSLLQNRSDCTLTDVTLAAGLGERQLPTQTSGFADFDLDGDPDLYVGSESSPRVRCASQLFRNNGGGTFTNVAFAAGFAARMGAGDERRVLAVGFRSVAFAQPQ